MSYIFEDTQTKVAPSQYIFEDEGSSQYTFEDEQEGHYEGWIKPSIEDVWKGVKATPKVLGNILTGVAGFVPSGWAGIKGYIETGDLEKANEAMEHFVAKYTMQSDDELSQRGTEIVMTPLILFKWLSDQGGDLVLKLGGSADLAASTATAIEMTFLEFLGAGMGKLKGKPLPAEKVLNQKLTPEQLAEIKPDLVRIQKEEIASRIDEIRSQPKPLKELVKAEKSIANFKEPSPLLTPEGRGVPDLTAPRNAMVGKPGEGFASVQSRPELPKVSIEGQKPKHTLPPKMTAEEYRLKLTMDRVRKPKKPSVDVNRFGGNDTTLSFMGTEQVFESMKKGVEKLREAGIAARNIAMNLVSVEDRFRRVDGPETGFHAKNYFTQRASWEDWTIQKIAEVAKESGFKEDLLQVAPLIIESQKALKNAGSNVKALGELYNKFKDDLAAEYKERGVTFNFKERIIDQIKDLLDEADVKDVPQLKKALKTAEDLNWVHIAPAWFENMLGDSVGRSQALKILATHERKSLNIKSLIDRGLIKPEDVNLTGIMASQGRRAARDFALLDLRNSAIKEGLAREKVGWQVKKGQRPPAGFVEIPVSVAPVFKNHYVHKVMADYIQTEMMGRGLDLGPVNKVMSLSKMSAFINPGILPMYDMVQHSIKATLKKWSVKNPKANIPFYYTAKGIKEYYNRTPRYYEALNEGGLASQPYNSPFNTWEGLVEWANKSKKAKTIRILKSFLPHKTIQSTYNASWHLAWEMDKAIRMGTYEMLRDKGLSVRDAGQTAARAHSDYASIPPRVRRLLNIPFFTPTFKLTMGKFWIQMMKDAVKTGADFVTGKAIDKKQLTFAQGAAGVLIINAAFDLFMTEFQGFKRDEWGRRYVKEIEDEKGEKKEIVQTWSAPSNMWFKYVSRWNAANKPWIDKKMLRFLEMNRWEFHPVWRTSYDLVQNNNGLGDEIWNEFDPEDVRLKKQMRYALTSIVALFRGFDAQPSTKEARRLFVKEVGQLWELASRPFTFKYMRATEETRKYQRVRSMKRKFERALRRGELNQEQVSQFFKILDEIDND